LPFTGGPLFRFQGRRGKEVAMRRLWRLLAVVAVYAAKRLIDWFFDKKN
jgi:hypothetical protein